MLFPQVYPGGLSKRNGVGMDDGQIVLAEGFIGSSRPDQKANFSASWITRGLTAEVRICPKVEEVCAVTGLEKLG